MKRYRHLEFFIEFEGGPGSQPRGSRQGMATYLYHTTTGGLRKLYIRVNLAIVKRLDGLFVFIGTYLTLPRYSENFAIVKRLFRLSTSPYLPRFTQRRFS